MSRSTSLVAVGWALALPLLEAQDDVQDPGLHRDVALQNQTYREGLEDVDFKSFFHGLSTICYNITGLTIVVSGLLLGLVNERRHVRLQAIISRARSKVVGVSSPEEANFGDLVHVCGMLETSDAVLVDTGLLGLSNVQAPVGALKLKRIVEMYQWVEACRNRSAPEWVRVPARLLGKLQGWSSMALTELVSARLHLNNSYETGCLQAATFDPWIFFRFKGNSGTQPGIGDVRIRYCYVTASAVSITAVFTGDDFIPMCFKDVVPRCKKRASTSLGAISLEEDEHESLISQRTRVDNFEEEQDFYRDVHRGVQTLSRLDPARFLLEWYIICTCCGVCLAFFEASVPSEVYVIVEGIHSVKKSLKSLEGGSTGMGAMRHSLRVLSFLVVWAGVHSLATLFVSIFAGLPLLGNCVVASLRVATWMHALSLTIVALACAWFPHNSNVGKILLINALGFCALALSIGHLAS